MRTTLNIDDDLAAQITELARTRATSMSRVTNELLRAGLRADQTDATPAPYQPPTFDSGRPLVDVTDLAAALEVLADES